MIWLFSSFCLVNAQRIDSYKIETSKNEKERKQMLNLLRGELKKNHRQDFIFVVRRLNVSSNGYAWLEVDVKRQDGKKVVLEEMQSCCHAEAAFKKVKGRWQIIESMAFSNDMWWDRIKGFPKKISFFIMFSKKTPI